MTNMLNMWKSRVKPGENLGVNPVHIFAKNWTKKFYPLLFAPLPHPFTHLSHQLINNQLSSVLIKTFPLLHSPYNYYYDLFKYNNIKERI